MKKLKTPIRVKETFSDNEINRMRDNCKNTRDIAIIETLNTTAVRVSELCSLNRSDITDRVAIVRGKGNKERKIYFSDSAWYYVDRYLKERDDDNPSLFVGIRASKKTGKKERITKDSVECMIRKIGAEVGVKAYPHKFRRSLATRGALKGIPVQNIQRMLGHSSISTTMIYCEIPDDEVRYLHEKYL